MVNLLFEHSVAAFLSTHLNKVICLDFMLDIGDIKEPLDSLYRKELLSSIYDTNNITCAKL